MAERPASHYKFYDMGMVKQALLKKTSAETATRYNATNGVLVHCMHMRCMHVRHVRVRPLLREDDAHDSSDNGPAITLPAKQRPQ